MLDQIFAWHIHEELGGRFITIPYKKTIAASDTGSYTLADAEDGATFVDWLTADNFILWDVFAYAEPGYVDFDIRADDEAGKKFQLIAAKTPTRLPLLPPKLVEVDLIINYTNEAQLNNVYLSFSGMRISESHYAEFVDLATRLPGTLFNIDLQTLNIQKLLANLQAMEAGEAPIYDIGPARPVIKPKGLEFCKRTRK